MADTFRSKHAGKPGSLMAIRVDYPPPGDPRSGRRSEIRKYKSGLRIGEKPEWNATTIDEMHQFPSHSPQRVLSEFQGVKMEYNYRANALPSINHDTIFVRKPNKMQIDASLFLSKAEKSRVVATCPGTNAGLSRREIENVEGRDSEQSWNGSTQLTPDRNSVYRLPVHPSLLDTNKKKNLVNLDTYVAPMDQHVAKAASQREAKLSQRRPFAFSSDRLSSARESDLQLSTGGTFVCRGAPQVFKMSNRRDWWDKNPVPTPTISTDGHNEEEEDHEHAAADDSVDEGAAP
eukprot:CAMPEP_0176409260 /NCGR_PEP_ID=MMETSP0127-20121128/2402_1 /TAXON_ID=938130 /ORGANISM="Platyophrya macrostoma, Strain WH" /LENGTH=289 /DNA_ID=CAMNT_0017788625 /DNA_START=62 /DNA_END=927 /DNA_ORIENTATION=-